MADDLIFFTNPMSRGRIVRWMLEETGAPYRPELMDFATIKNPAYLAINPMGKVPAIKHGDTVVTEAAAICAYLADAFPRAGLAPGLTDPKRGAYYRWLFFAAACVEPAATNKSLGLEPPADKSVMVGYGSMKDVLDTLETAVSAGPFILGEHFSAADVYVGSQIGWGTHFGTLEKRPAFDAYLGRVMGRPAAVRAREIDDALIAQQQKQA